MITWNFEGTNVTFKSQPQNLARDISKMAHANHLDPNTKIIIHNDKTTNPDRASKYGNTTSAAVPTLPLGSKESKPSKTSIQLRNVPGDVDGLDSLFFPLTSTTGVNPNGIGSNSVSDESDGQVTL